MIMYANVLLLLVRLNGKHTIYPSFIYPNSSIVFGCVSNNSYWCYLQRTHNTSQKKNLPESTKVDFDTQMLATDKYSVIHCVIDNVEYKHDWRKRNRASFIINSNCARFFFSLVLLTAFATLFSVWIIYTTIFRVIQQFWFHLFVKSRQNVPRWHSFFLLGASKV